MDVVQVCRDPWQSLIPCFLQKIEPPRKIIDAYGDCIDSKLCINFSDSRSVNKFVSVTRIAAFFREECFTSVDTDDTATGVYFLISFIKLAFPDRPAKRSDPQPQGSISPLTLAENKKENLMPLSASAEVGPWKTLSPKIRAGRR